MLLLSKHINFIESFLVLIHRKLLIFIEREKNIGAKITKFPTKALFTTTTKLYEPTK